MSSRALRRLQRERDTELCSVSHSSEVKGEGDANFEEVTADASDSAHDHDSLNYKSSSGPRNMFDLVIAVCCNFDFDVQVLGPLLSVIYINDFTEFTTEIRNGGT